MKESQKDERLFKMNYSSVKNAFEQYKIITCVIGECKTPVTARRLSRATQAVSARAGGSALTLATAAARGGSALA